MSALALGILIDYSNGSAAATGIRVLDEPAIQVRNPSSVFLISIAQAGSRLVAVGEHGVIILSDDNGKTWRQAAVPVNVTITSVAFATPEDGWAAGAYGVILHTNDGGLIWSIQLYGAQVNQLMLSEAQVLSSQNPLSPSAQRAVRRANIFNQAGPDKPFLTVVAVSPETAIVYGAYRMAVKTTDGGKTWQDISLQVGDPISHNIYDATLIGSDIYLIMETGLIFRSTDGGATYESVASPTGNTLFGINKEPDGSLLLFGVVGALFRSSDAGNTWSQINLGISDDISAALTLKSGQTIIVTEGGEAFLSKDDGQTFRSINLPGGMEMSDLTQANDGNIVIVGADGVQILDPADLRQS